MIVSGAGPSGSAAALGCARAGLSTLLLDKHRLPRSKCCAGGVLGRALGNLGLTLPYDLVEREISGFTVVRDDFRKEVEFDRPAGVTVRRERFDNFLSKTAERAGAEILDGVEIMRVHPSSRRVEVITGGEEMSCRHLVIAEGAASRTAREVLGPYPRGGLAVGLASIVETEVDAGGSIEIHLMDTPTRRIGWGANFPLNGWMFPLDGAVNIGVVGMGVPKTDLRGSVESIARGLSLDMGEIKTCSAPLPTVPRKRVVAGRCIAVGDAAGFVNQITGEGMSYALESGDLASRAVVDAIEKDNPDLLRVYQRGCDDHILPDLRATALIGPVLHWLVGVVDTDRFFDIFCSDSLLVEECLGIANGEDSWTGLFRSCLRRFPRLFFSSLV